jgi:hypothetical protein
MPIFQKTCVMNMVGIGGFSILGILLFFNKLYDQSPGVLATFALMYAFLVFVPAGTARALSQEGSKKLQRTMLFANWSAIALGCIAAVAPILIHQPLSMGMAMGCVLFLVLPEAINIRALRAAIAAKIPRIDDSIPRQVAPV